MQPCGQNNLLSSILLLLPVVLSSPRYSSRIVEIASGSVRGIIVDPDSRQLDPVEVFRGIPYAAPPVGKLRLLPPQPIAPWKGIRLAEHHPPVCPQKLPDISNKTAALLKMPLGRYLQLKRILPLLQNQSEDCLYLNLYVPASGNIGIEAPYAVMVFIHGESYEWNSGNFYDASVLTSLGHVIVLTVNYRLGILGFLKTRPGPDTPTQSGGNLALRDIQSALKWVQTNIATFGGDPGRVTLWGHDTGAALVNLLLLQPSARLLFHRAVLMSGSALSPWAVMQQPDIVRRLVADRFGCKNSNDTVGCLQNLELKELMSFDVDVPRFLSRFGPSIPADMETADPEYAMEHDSANFVTRDIVLCVATTESYLDFNANDIQYGFEEDQRNRVLRTYIRNTFVYHLNEIFSTIRNEYTDWEKPILHPINIRDSTMEALSDGHTVSPLIRLGYLHSRRGAKTYFCHFGYQSKESEYPQRLGSVRGEMLSYVFGWPLVGGMTHFFQNFTKQDLGVAELVLNLFSNFAKTGDPNEPRNVRLEDYGSSKEKTKHKGLFWEPYDIQNQQYLSIALKPKMKNHYRGHKMAIWLNLIPQLHQPGDDDVSMRHHHFHERSDIYYDGSLQPEHQTRLPPPYVPVTRGVMPASVPECPPNITTTPLDEIDEDEANGILQKLADSGYHNYATALGVTVGVGCLFLLINIFIFIGIYCHRERKRKKRPRAKSVATKCSETDMEMADCGAHVIKIHEPCYILNKSPTLPEPPRGNKEPPRPPVRSSSSLSVVKKRVQIQEISV